MLEFLPGRTLSAPDVRRPATADRVAAACRRLHAGPRFGNDFSIIEKRAELLAICRQHDLPLPDRYLDRSSTVDRIGATVLVEPVSGAPHYPLKTAADVIRVIDRVHAEHGSMNLRLLADLYPLDVNGDDTSAVIQDHGDRIGHVQIADAPGRGEPGTGELALAGQFRELAERGYTGYIGLEYKATRPDTFDWLPRADRAPTA